MDTIIGYDEGFEVKLFEGMSRQFFEEALIIAYLLHQVTI